MVGKYSRHTAIKSSEAEMLIHFCQRLKKSGISFRNNQTLENLYNQQLKKLNALLALVHEDLRYDYLKQVERLTLM